MMQDPQSIASIIDQKLVEPHFQGVINFYTEEYFAFEALIRTKPAIENIQSDLLFSMAESQGYLLELDRLCVLLAIEKFQNNGLPGCLFVNILPVNLGKILPSLTTNNSTTLKGIVFEISEKHPLTNMVELKEHIKILRQHGALIAIDDLGAGHSGLIAWAEIKPDFVKIDRHFVDNIHIDSVKREFVQSIAEIARGLRCKVIAEGIETTEELNILNEIGIKLGQGYLLHRPEASPSPKFMQKRFFNMSQNFKKHLHIRHAETAESLIEIVTPIPSTMNASQVNDLFKNDNNLRCLPIVNGNIPQGIISRTHILEIFSGRYSYPLHGEKAITELIDTNPMMVDHKESLQNISMQLTNDDSTDLNSDFIITKNKQYCGVGRVSTLLKVLTETQIQRARHSNPLTLLPGNVPIDEHIEDLITQHQHFYLAYFDINHFKPFNDHFGYSCGDEVIKKLSTIIIEHTSTSTDMVGHIGGDDFVVVFRCENWEEKCQRILDKFKEFTLKFYTKQEIDAQGVWYKDRRGNKDFFHILSLAIGVINPDTSSSISHHDVAELASNAKKQAKLATGNYLFLSQRRTNAHPTSSMTH